MEAKFNVRDRVRVVHNDDKGKAGVIVRRSTMATGLLPNDKPLFAEGKARGKEQGFWYEVQLDETTELKLFAEDNLEIIE